MTLEPTRAKNGARAGWARTGALVLFLLTAILLITSLNTAQSNSGGVARAQIHSDTAQSQALPSG